MKNQRKGFTIVELTLAMAFVGILLISIAVLVIRVTAIYQHGLAIRAVSSGGRQLIDDLSRSISASPIVDVAYIPSRDDEITANITKKQERFTYKYYFQKTVSDSELGLDLKGSSVPVAGAFCTGLYTYIWNTAYAINSYKPDGVGSFKGFTYTYSGGTLPDAENPPFRLIRIPDSERSICISQRLEDGKIKESTSSFVAPSNQGDPVELLPAVEDDLALYDFRAFPASTSRITGHIFYSNTFILATLKGGVDITRKGDYCTVDGDTLGTDFNYCSINKFNFAMRATGELRGGNYVQGGE